ncbi:MAG: hypothetical protein CL663_08995 [Bacteroidetes bacterium]|nr:hypothetical protein [Bacteroidota bacterium]
MNYYIGTKVTTNFEKTIEVVTEKLQEQGFGVLTEIDVKATLKKKIDVDFKKYMILGACNPSFAHQALSVEDKLGALLPCNVIVIEQENGEVEVYAIDAQTMMQQINNPDLNPIASQVSEKLQWVLDQL